jgi:uncharacterized protein (TIGR03066 family)
MNPTTPTKGHVMKTVRMVLALCVVAGLSSAANAEEKGGDLKKQLLGKWEATKADPDTLPVGSVVEFKADGKLTVIAKKGGKDAELTGTYTMEPHGFSYKLKVGDDEHSAKITVKKISDTEMDSENPEGKKVSFKKVK